MQIIMSNHLKEMTVGPQCPIARIIHVHHRNTVNDQKRNGSMCECSTILETLVQLNVGFRGVTNSPKNVTFIRKLLS